MIFAVVAAVVVVAGLAGFAFFAAQWPARGRPRHFLAGPRPKKPVVVCVGDSLTHGRVSFPWVDVIVDRMPRIAFVNAGENGDLAVTALRRLDAIRSCRPDAVVILLGSNDANALADEGNLIRYRRSLQLANPPSLEGYRAALQSLVGGLRRDSKIPIALVTIPPLGEDLAAAENDVVRAINNVVVDVAAADCDVLPLYDRIAEILARRVTTPRTKWRPGMSLVPVPVLWRQLARSSYDSIAAGRGLLVTHDTLHLTETGGAPLIHLVESWLQDRVLTTS